MTEASATLRNETPSMTIALGQALPAFTAQTTGGAMRSADYIGKTLVLYFYPKDSTPGCTTESQNFRDHHDAFVEAGARIFGISRDSLKSHGKFKADLELPFELISDPDEALCAAFGVMKMKNMYGKQVRGVDRSTFVIDANGILLRKWRGVKVTGHVPEVLEYVESL